MPKGELFIQTAENGEWLDAYDTWGISMSSTALSSLMTPAPNKAVIENKNRAKNGKEVITKYPKKDERDITMAFNLTAPNETEFFRRYEAFCSVLDGGVLNICTCYQPSVVYRTLYVSCTQLTEYLREMALFSLRLNEPDPSNRTLKE